jgi:hypothetical protein
MKSNRFLPMLLSAALLLVLPSEAAKRKKSFPKLDQMFAPEKLKEDFRVLQNALEKLHPGLYLYTPKEKFDQLFKDTHLAFQKPATVRDFYLRVGPVVEKAKCGHTYFDLPWRLLNQLQKEEPLFPLPLFFLNQKAYVDLKDQPIPLGAEVTAINGTPMTEILPKLLSYLRSDGFNETMKHRMLADEFALHYRLVFGAKKIFEIEHTAFGEKQKEKVEAIAGVQLQKTLIRRHSGKGKLKNYKFKWADNNTGVLSINSFDFGLNKKGRQKYRSFLKKTFTEIKSREKVSNLIVDARYNEGGYVGNDALLFSYLTHKPFREAKSVIAKTLDIPLEDFLDKKEFFRGVEKAVEKSLNKEFVRNGGGLFRMIDDKNKIHKPKALAFEGSIYILISGWTHSGGSVLCSMALNNDNVVFIGEETGGGHQFYTAGNMVLYTLPNTQCQVEVPMIRYQSNSPAKAFPKGSGIRPHHSVIQTREDFIKGTDSVMQFTLDLIKAKKN